MNIKQQLFFVASFILLLSPSFFSQSPVGLVGSGCAMGFDGVDDYIEIPASDDFTPGTGAITVSFWIKFVNQSSGDKKIFDWYPFGITGNSSITSRYKFKVNNNFLTWEVKDDNNVSHNVVMPFSNYSSPYDNQWHFLVGTIDVPANETKMYFDGVLIGTNTTTINSLTTAGNQVPIQLGRELYLGNGLQYFQGDIDEIRFWNYARSEDEIRQDMCRALAGTEPGLTAFWNFNQCVGSFLLDSSGNGHDGIINNSPTWKTSGAPLGNVSSFNYTNDWNNQELSLTINNEDSFVVNNVSNLPEGIHIYGIDMEPNTLDTIAMINNNDRYFGVFSTHIFGQNPSTFSVNYYYGNQPYVNPGNEESVGLYSRLENDSTLWTPTGSVNNIFQQRVSHNNENNRSEYMMGIVPSGCSLDLGEDLFVCNPDTVHLEVLGTWNSTLWSTGETESMIAITTSGNYTVLATDSLGCTASDTINVTVYPSYNYTNSITICEGDSVFLEGAYQFTTGSYLDSLTTTEGCDSIVNTVLTVVFPSYNSLTLTVCDSMVSPNNYVWTSTGIYTDTLINAVGCDSVITYNLTVNQTTYGNETVTACDEYLSPSGNYLWTTSGIMQDTIPNALGCDSVITIDLTINPTTYESLSELACDEYISPSGLIWNQTDIYTDTIPNQFGCNNIMTIDLEIVITPDPTITTDEMACVRESEFTLEADEPGGTWSGNGIVDADNGIFDPSSVGIGLYDITYALGGDCPAQTTYQLEVVDCELLWQHFYVPNIFSPNNDNSNDVFYVYGDRIAEMELVIFDRWGEKVFETIDKDVGWDGTYRGKPVDPSVLAFQLRGKYISGLEFEKSGYITLIR